MDKKLGFEMVQGQIGYRFKNIDLLNQAFTRRSYTEENGGENNEILEFIGDKALDLAVVKVLVSKFGHIDDVYMGKPQSLNFKLREMLQMDRVDEADGSKEFSCECTENELTKIKSRMVEKRTLANRIDELGFAELLLMGKGDIKNNVAKEMSVMEDLFEAILGAVTIDCGWNFPVIESVVEAMLVPEDFIESYTDENYVRMIYDWEREVNGTIPWFWFKENGRTESWYLREPDVIYHTKPITVGMPDYDEELKYSCKLKLLDNLPVFCGFGKSKSEARMDVCQFAYEYLEKDGTIKYITMRDEIDEPSKNKAINQLEILARRDYFSIPTYEFEESHDDNGNPIWRSRCRIKEYDKSFTDTSSSKKEAKKLSALKMLRYVIAEDEKEENGES